ncbi:hypothetical protein [Gottfriedia luciferensis]|uniref:hypothetical protein n=1 Tax=Gottfriedia luciferensis TaxID=178774 RepID=UPI000B44F9C1|nr:hypothetical protein [Gottfriedia luciferensis]
MKKIALIVSIFVIFLSHNYIFSNSHDGKVDKKETNLIEKHVENRFDKNGRIVKLPLPKVEIGKYNIKKLPTNKNKVEVEKLNVTRS